MKKIPHDEEFKKWRKKISAEEYRIAVDAIKELIKSKDGVFNSSHLPGKNWAGTPFEPLYRACGKSEQQSGYFFGLMVWEVMMELDDKWFFKPTDKDSGDPLGKTYFRESK